MFQIQTDSQLSPGSQATRLWAALAQFDCSWTARGSQGAWVQVAGEVDLATAPRLGQTLTEAQAHARLVVLDLRAVSFIDGTGIHAILTAAAHAREAGARLTLVRGPAQVQRALELTGVHHYLPIFDLDRNHSVEGQQVGKPRARAVISPAPDRLGLARA